MNLSELINEILSEWAYRVDNGTPNPKNTSHIEVLSEVLTEMGMGNIKGELLESLREADKQFTNPILNKEIPYKAEDGTTKKGIVGNLLRLPKEHPGRIAAEKMLPPDPQGKKDAMKDLGSEKDGHSTTPQPKQEPKDKEDGGEGGGQADTEAEKQKAVQAMFQDPTYVSARLDAEKAAAEKLEKEDPDKGEDGGTFGTNEKPKKEESDFEPVQPDDITKEMPEADTAVFNQDSDIESISPQERHAISTKIDELDRLTQDAKNKGEKAPNYNLCDVAVPGTNLYCDNNLGIPREDMPQFKGKPQPGSQAEKLPKDKNGEVDTEEVFKKMLADKGIKTIDTEIPSDSLKASQSELVGSKVAGMTKALEEDPMNKGITAPIYVSRDGYVIDGHHRWAAMTSKAIKDGKPVNMKVHVIDMDAKDIIPMANKFAQSIGVAAKKADANAETTPSHKEEPKPEPADETPGGIVYNVGGNYYSDSPDGPAQYIKTESVLDGILVEENETYLDFLFETNVIKKTSKGNTVKLKTIDPKDQKKATVAAKAEKQPSDLESNRQEIKSPTTEKEADGMRKFTDKSVTDSLKLSKSEVKAREEAIKIKYEKQVADWKKKKDAAKAKGIKFTETKPKPPSKGVGLGSPESRAGESAVVKGCLLMKQNYDSCMVKSKDSKKCYQAAREITESQLRKYVTKDSFLTNEWVDSAMATLDLIHNEIGFGNIQEIGWDNQEGRALVGSQGHGTSSDMFVKLKPSKNYHKGKRIGISLKKDLKVFIYSGGWATLQDKIAERGFQLSDASKIDQYLKRRNEELYEVKKFANDPDSKNKFCADLDNLKKHPERISSKPNVVASRMNDILKVTKAKNIKSLDCDTFINSVVNVAQTGDTMKIIGDMCKSSTDPELKHAYGRMRAIDREMTDSIATDFSKPENQKVVKKLVRDETHISDILFGENPNLDELKVVYGTDPAIEMKKEQLCQLFGIKDLYAKFEAEKDPKKKEAIKKQIEKAIDDKIVISTKGGVMSIAINVEGPDGKPSPLPLFEAKIRTRGFGNAPTFEMAQNTFGGLSFKYGHTDYNGMAVDKNGKKIHQPWSNEDKKIVVGSMMKDIMDDFQDDLDNLDDKTKAEIGLRLSKLENIYPNHPAVKKFKRDYLDAAKATVAKKAPK